jgi:hypothetical protein
MNRILLVAMTVFSACVAGRQGARGDDGLRKVDVKRYGIVVRVPQAWSLVDWAQNEHAFVLKLPQDEGSKVGLVTCQLSVASTSLEDFRQRQQAFDQKQADERGKLIENRLEPLDPARYGAEAVKQIGRRLISVWQHDGQQAEPTWYEARIRLVSHQTLYTFTLTSDEAHYESYRLDLEDMLGSAQFSPPETGLQRLPGGYWLQRDYRFALQLPDGWQPAFAPHDKVLFFATGPRHESFTDNMLVLASPAAPLDLNQLKERYAAEIAKADPTAEIESCQIVPHAGGAALETVIHTKRGPYRISILERRFRGPKRNYEIKFTCETKELKANLDKLRKALDSFQELQEPAEKAIL